MKDADNQDNTAGKGTKGSAKTSGKQEAGKLENRKQSPSAAPAVQAAEADKVTPAMIESVRSMVEKYSTKGLKMEKILKMYSIKDMTEMSVAQYKDCMNKLELYKKADKEGVA